MVQLLKDADPRHTDPLDLVLFGDFSDIKNVILPSFPWVYINHAALIIAKATKREPAPTDMEYIRRIVESSMILPRRRFTKIFREWRLMDKRFFTNPDVLWDILANNLRPHDILDRVTNPDSQKPEYKPTPVHTHQTKTQPQKKTNHAHPLSSTLAGVMQSLTKPPQEFSARKAYYERIKATPLFDYLSEACELNHSPAVWKFMFQNSNKTLATRNDALYTCGLAHVAKSLNIGVATVQRSVSELKKIRALIRRKAPDYEKGICSHYKVAVSTLQLLHIRTSKPGRKKTTSQDAPGHDFSKGPMVNHRPNGGENDH